MALVDTDLQVRYFMDEAASGQTPTENLDDGGGTAMDLTIVYDGTSDLVFDEPSANHRGMDHTTIVGNPESRCDHTLTAGDKLLANVQGSKVATFELRCAIQDASGSNGRIAVVNDIFGGDPTFGFTAASDESDMRFYLNDVLVRSWDAGDTLVHLWTVVIDTAQPTADDRVVVSKDGSDFSASTTKDANPAQDATIDLEDGLSEELICFNRETSGSFNRAIVGQIRYVAIYSGAFTSTNVSDNDDELDTSDDTPGGAPPPSIHRHPWFRQLARM